MPSYSQIPNSVNVKLPRMESPWCNLTLDHGNHHKHRMCLRALGDFFLFFLFFLTHQTCCRHHRQSSNQRRLSRQASLTTASFNSSSVHKCLLLYAHSRMSHVDWYSCLGVSEEHRWVFLHSPGGETVITPRSHKAEREFPIVWKKKGLKRRGFTLSQPTGQRFPLISYSWAISK